MRRLGSSGLIGAAKRTGALAVVSRSYWHVVPADAVKDGNPPSASAAHPSPNMQKKIIKEYALSPIFGSRLSAARIGAVTTPVEFLSRKKHIQSAIDQVLDIPEGSTTLGLIQEMKGTHNYVLCDVYFPSDWEDLEVIVFGEELLDIVKRGHSRLAQLGVTEGCEPVVDIAPFFSGLFNQELTTPEVEEIHTRWEARQKDVDAVMQKEAEEREKLGEYLEADPFAPTPNDEY